jgi:hypothetical protein
METQRWSKYGGGGEGGACAV